MHENDLSFFIRKAIFTVHNALGPGLHPSVYIKALKQELEKLGLKVDPESMIFLDEQSAETGAGCRVDMLVSGKVIIEVKSVEEIRGYHFHQVLPYLHLSAVRPMILVNFNTDQIARSIHRFEVRR